MRCKAANCPRTATMGSRCALHWMRRRRAGRELRKYKWWVKYWEKKFAAGLDLRRVALQDGPLPLPDLHFPPKVRIEWTRLTGELIADFDKETKHEDDHCGCEAS